MSSAKSTATTTRNTPANANAVGDWRIHADFAQSLINFDRKLYVNEPFSVDWANTVYALDATTIDLWLSVFPGAQFRSTKAAVRLHTLLDLRGNIPSFLHISDGKWHEVNVFDHLIPEAGAFYVVVSLSLAGRVVLQMHQATSAYRSLIRNLGERRWISYLPESHRAKISPPIPTS